jgi:hypothetical protein
MAIGDFYYNTNTTNMYIGSGNGYTTTLAPLTYTSGTTYTITTASPNVTTYNGDPNTPFISSIFQTTAERIDYQQKAYEEPRDHEYNPDGPGSGTCADCYSHNLHRWSPEKHLYVINEDEDWLLRLAS